MRNGLVAMAASQVAAAVIRRDRKTRKPIFMATGVLASDFLAGFFAMLSGLLSSPFDSSLDLSARPLFVLAEWLRARTSRIWSGRGIEAGHT